MKKLLAIVLSLMLVLSLAACSEAGNGNETNPGNTTGSSKPDDGDTPSGGLEGYPADLNEWTADDIVRYFTEAGVFTNESWVMVMGPKEWAGTAINDYITYMDNTGMVSISIATFDPENEMVDVPAFLDFVRENHTYDESLYLQPVDHMVGNMTFTFEGTMDEEVYNAMLTAYNALLEGLGVTPDF